jgi:hypothetical protein
MGFRGALASVFRLLVRLSANALLPVYFLITRSNPDFHLACSSSEAGHREFVVSLTSFPARIGRVWLVIESLLRQTAKPDRLVLWLSRDQFPSASSVPRSLRRLTARGLTIRFVDRDFRSHKKYCYAKEEYPAATLVLVDDDIFYPSNMLEQLISAAREMPGSVVARYVKRIATSSAGQVQPYAAWPTVEKPGAGVDYFFGSGGGVLIPPNAMHSDVVRAELFLAHCPLADDIWLNAMCRLISPRIVVAGPPFSALPVMNFARSSLSSVNNGEQLNDTQLRATRVYCKAAYGRDPFVGQ